MPYTSRHKRYSPAKVELLKPYQDEYHECQRRKPVAVGSNDVRKGLSSIKASTIFTRATSHIIDVTGYRLITYPTDDEIMNMDEVERVAGGYHDPEAITEDEDTNLGANVASATSLNTNNRNEKKRFARAQEERLLEAIGVGGRKMKLNDAQKAVVRKKIHEVSMTRTFNLQCLILTLLLQQISSYMATQYRKERVGKELPTKAMEAIVNKTVDKPQQQLQQWQMHIRRDPIAFQDRYVRFKSTPKGQAMHELAAMQEVAKMDFETKDESYLRELDRQRTIEYHERYVRYEHELAALNTAEPTAREWSM
jgi:hypothetical protein